MHTRSSNSTLPSRLIGATPKENSTQLLFLRIFGTKHGFILTVQGLKTFRPFHKNSSASHHPEFRNSQQPIHVRAHRHPGTVAPIWTSKSRTHLEHNNTALISVRKNSFNLTTWPIVRVLESNFLHDEMLCHQKKSSVFRIIQHETSWNSFLNPSAR